MESAKYLEQCVEIWNSYANGVDTVFKPMTADKFTKMFIVEHSFKTVSATESDNNGVVGFGYANYAGEGAAVAYITYIGVRKDSTRKGVGTRILEALEEKLRTENPSLEKIELVFYNPCQLGWFIPNFAPHDHPGTPGVDMESAAYKFFAKHGYVDYAIQNAYYLNLDNYNYPDDVVERIEKLKEKGIDICYYDNDKNFGFSEFFDNIKNEGWRNAVMSRLDEDIVIASDNGKVVGYTGPLSLSPEGRGMFCGIGVHTEYRQHGIGKLLFASLCKGLSEKGAQYMSLFTGTTNPARKIYEGAGFSIVRTFADMRKVLN